MNSAVEAILQQASVSPDTWAERQRCIEIIRNSVPANAPWQSMPSSYDATELREAGGIRRHEALNEELKMRWRIERLKAKSLIAKISGTYKIPDTDEDDDRAIMDLGLVP